MDFECRDGAFFFVLTRRMRHLFWEGGGGLSDGSPLNVRCRVLLRNESDRAVYPHFHTQRERQVHGSRERKDGRLWNVAGQVPSVTSVTSNIPFYDGQFAAIVAMALT